MRLALGWSLAVLALVPCARGGTQSPPREAARLSCDGDTITAVEVRSNTPSSGNIATTASRTTMKFLGIQYVPTRPAVVAAYLRVAGGDLCTELDRRESERLLRAQPFLSSATVRTVPDGPGRVRLLVEVVDELPLVVGGSLSHGTVESVLLGTQNLRGRGFSVSASAERGFAYRSGFGLSAAKYAMFGLPDYLAIAGSRTPLGDQFALEFAQPFLTDLQVRAYHARFGTSSDYYGVVPPTGDALSLYVRRSAYDVGWVTRIGRASGRGAVGLLGAAALGEYIRTGGSPVIVSDSGFVPAAGSPVGAYPSYASARIAAIAGLRSLRFTTVRGFDALTAEQDMGTGVQVDLLAGPSVWASGGTHDVFVAGDLYAGTGNARSFFSARALAEMRGNHDAHGWDGVAASSRLAWYGKPADDRTALASLEFSGVQRLNFPLQLSFRDADGGLPGFANSTLSGGQRAVARVEQRWVMKGFSARADLGLAVFADAGKLWAGDVPFGETTGLHASAGVSILAAYPAGGKRTYRVDLAVPFNPQGRGAHLELRLSSNDRTRLLWTEPADIAGARTGAVPVSLMKW